MFLDRNEVERSRRYGFPILWRVAAAHEIIDGVLRPVNGAGVRFYAPMGRADLVNALARLARGDEPSVIRFARRFGLLGHTWIVPRDQRRGGDPIAWVRAQAADVRLCLELLLALQERDDATLKETLSKKVCEAWMRARATSDRPWERSWEGRARRLLREILNVHLQRLHPQLFNAKDRSKVGFTFAALVDVVFWKLALQLDRGTGRGIVTRCAAVGCDGIFFQTDRRQRFCPSPEPKAESPCAIRQRLRDRRGSSLSSRHASSRARAKPKKGGRHGTSRR